MHTGEYLPYRSTIVWPIRKLVYPQDGEDGNRLNHEQDIIGYLCVDSARQKVFRNDYDTQLGAIVADSVFIFLKRYHEYLQNAAGNSNQ